MSTLICPNYNSQEWKDLVQEAGSEFEAHYHFYTSGDYVLYQPNTESSPIVDATEVTLDNKQLEKQSENLKKSIKTLKVKLSAVRRMGQNIRDSEKLEQKKEELAGLIKRMENETREKAFIDYINNAYRETMEQRKRFDEKKAEGTLNSKYLRDALHYIEAYKNLEEIGNQIAKHSPKMERMVEDYIGKIMTKRKNLLLDIQEEALEPVVEKLAPHVRSERRKIIDGWRREYRQVNGNPRNEDEKEDEREFLRKRELEREDEILNASKDKIRQQLQYTKGDIAHAKQWLYDTKNMNDDILKTVAVMVDKADQNVEVKTRELAREMDRLFKDYQKGTTDPLKLWAPFLEKDKHGNLTGNLVSKYSYEWYEKYLKFFREELPEMVEQQQLGEDQKKKVMSNWFKTNPRELSKQYKELKGKDKEVYDKFVKIIGKSDQDLPRSQRMIKVISNGARDQNDRALEIARIQLPFMYKQSMERLSSGEYKNMVSDLGRSYRKEVDDEGMGTYQMVDGKIVREDEEGNLVRTIPLYYRLRGKVEDQSFDLPRLLLSNFYTSENFKEKSKILHDLELTKILVGNRQVARMSGSTAMMVDRDTPSTQLGETTHTYKALENFLDGRLYGIEELMFDVNGINVNKPAKQFMKYTSMVLIGLNPLSSVANVTFGQTVRLIESIGGRHFGKGDMVTAYRKYMADVHNVFADSTRYDKHAKTSHLMERFGVMNDYTGPREEWTRNNQFKKMMSSNTFYFAQHAGEHLNMGMTMYALMNNIKAKDKDGNYLTREGTTKDRNKAASLDELYKVVDGKLEMDERVAYTDEGKWEGRESENRLALKIKELNYELDGAYSRQNRAELQRTILGKAIFQMRGFLIPGFKTRFEGITSFYRKDYERSYSEHLDEYKEGRYTTFLRFFKGMKKDGEALKFDVLSRWNEMDDMEKANIRKTLADMGIMAITYFLGQALFSLADDDEDYYPMTFMVNRLSMELMAYINPMDTLNVIRSPAATVSMIERIFEFISQAGHDVAHFDMEEYETGTREGRTKLEVRSIKLVPFWSSYERLKYFDEVIQWQENN